MSALNNDLIFDVYKEELNKSGLSQKTIVNTVIKSMKDVAKKSNAISNKLMFNLLDQLTYIALKVMAKLDDKFPDESKELIKNFSTFKEHRKDIISSLSRKEKFVLISLISSILISGSSLIIHKLINIDMPYSVAKFVMTVFKSLYMAWAKFVGRESIISNIGGFKKIRIIDTDGNKLKVIVDSEPYIIDIHDVISRSKGIKVFMFVIFFNILYFSEVELLLMRYAIDQLGLDVVPALTSTIITEISNKIVSAYEFTATNKKGTDLKLKNLYSIKDIIFDMTLSLISGTISYVAIKKNKNIVKGNIIAFLTTFLFKFNSMMRLLTVIFINYALTNNRFIEVLTDD